MTKGQKTINGPQQITQTRLSNTNPLKADGELGYSRWVRGSQHGIQNVNTQNLKR
jgi:hypothetical protein